MLKILNIFKKKKQNNTKLPVKQNSNKEIIRNDFIEDFNVHTDIKDLLWIENGPKKNYYKSKKDRESFSMNGITFTISVGNEEPSLIDMKLPLKKTSESQQALSYYPTYKDLTSKQRYKYWLFLSNPYSNKNDTDIGNLFILYYGLERHLFKGNIDKAVEVIIKLRSVYDNNSFQYYSGNAIVLSCLLRQRADLIQMFMKSLVDETEIDFSHELYLLTIWSFNYPIKPKIIIEMSKSFGFTKTNYIKGYPNLFEDTLTEKIYSKLGEKETYLTDYVKDINSLTKKESRLFANMSLLEEVIDIPDLLSNEKIINTMFNLLDEAHESVKKQLATMRKSNLIPTKKENKKKKAEIEFNYKEEARLLDELKECKDNASDRHFVYNALIKFYYKYRELDSMYLKECINYCHKDIDSLSQLDEVYRKERLEQLKTLRNSHERFNGSTFTKELQRINKELKNIDRVKFHGSIPAFQRLAIIYEKQREYEKAVEVSKKAIKHYSSREMDTSSFEQRLERLEEKMNKN